MVNTRRQAAQDAQSLHEDPDHQSRSAHSGGGSAIAPPRTPPASDGVPPRTPQRGSQAPHPPPPGSPSMSNVSLAGPGQRGRQLLELANPDDREAYMVGLEKLNERFARALRQNGVQIPRCE